MRPSTMILRCVSPDCKREFAIDFLDPAEVLDLHGTLTLPEEFASKGWQQQEDPSDSDRLLITCPNHTLEVRLVVIEREPTPDVKED